MYCVINTTYKNNNNKMGNNETTQIGFEVVQDFLQTKTTNTNTILVSTLSKTDQECMIQTTKSPEEEETIINEMLEKTSNITRIILYGKNARDATLSKKANQLKTLGLLSRIQLQVYSGGMFEWLLLQEIYGAELFPTTTKTMVDLLKYK